MSSKVLLKAYKIKNIDPFLSRMSYVAPFYFLLLYKLVKSFYKVNSPKNNALPEAFWEVYRILAKFGNQQFWNPSIFAKYGSERLKFFFYK